MSKIDSGNRKELIKITSENIPFIIGSFQNLIDGLNSRDCYFQTVKITNELWFMIDLKTNYYIDTFKLTGSDNRSIGDFDISYSKNGIDFQTLLINESINLNSSIKLDKQLRYLKFIGNDRNAGFLNSGPYLYEIEFKSIDVLYLINKESKYYSIQDSNYDIDSKSYIPLANTNGLNNLFIDNNLSIEELFVDKNINDETFKPINKFDNFRISKLVTL